MKKLATLFSFFLLLITACEPKSPEQPVQELTFAEAVEVAHQKEAFRANQSMQFDAVINFGGNQILKGTITARTDLSKIRIVTDDEVIIYDGTDVFLSPSSSSFSRPRFHIFTWTYFLTLPFKMTDPGTQWTSVADPSMNGNTYMAEKLTFNSGTGDTPEDWYIVYADEDSHQLRAASYIVTFSTSLEDAEADPHAIVYHDYETYDGVPISTRWSFHNWSEDGGLGEEIGDGAISRFIFLDTDDAYFARPYDAKLIEK